MFNRCLAVPLSLACVALLWPARPAAALNPDRTLTQAQHRIWQVPQGLPQPTVYAVYQSHDGYLWLGTPTGPVRFDGVRFAAGAETGGDAGPTHDFAEGPDGSLWIATDGGVRRIAGGVVTPFTTADGLPSDVTNALVVDRAGTVWAATQAGLTRFDAGRWARAGPADPVRALAVIEGRVWSATAATVHTGDGSTFDAVGTVTAIEPGPDRAVWVGTDRGLVRWDHGRARRFTTADGLAADAVTSLAAGSHDTLWVGTRNGVSRYRAGRFESFRAADGLSQSAVYAVTEDREGSLWVGTKHGLNQLLDRRAVPFTQSEGLASNDAGPVIGDDAGRLWAGTRNAGLCRFDGTRFAPPLTPSDGLASDRIAALAVAAGSGLWVGTDRGVDLLRDGRVVRRLTAADGLPSDDVTCLADDAGDLWVGTPNGAAVVGRSRARTVHGGPVLALGRWGRRMVLATADRGLLAVASDGGVSTLDPLTSADAVYADPAGLLWVGTRGDGLRLIDAQGKVTAFTPADGLFDDDVYGIVADDDGRLWMACSKGVFWVTRTDLMAFAGGRAKRVRCMPFSPTDALRTVECQPDVQPAVCRTRDGRLWFATIHGVMVFDPADFSAATTAAPAVTGPPAVVEDVVVDGRPQRPGSVGDLPPGVRHLTFRYTAMTLLGSTYARFHYQLDGFDPAPVDAGTSREAEYTNLPPGRYQFRVWVGQAGPVAAVAVGLTPRLDQRAWFLPAVALAAAVAGWGAYRVRVRHLRDNMRLRHAAASAERTRIARELHDTLLQGFSGVTMQLQAFTVRVRDGADRAVLTDIIHDASTCMAEARRSVAGLRDTPVGGLSTALATATRQLTETAEVDLHLDLCDGPDGLPPEAEYHLLRIAQEAVGNAVRHAAATRVDVKLNGGGDGRLRLTVADNGRGFDPAAPPLPGHFGLVGMRERAARIGAEIGVDSRPGQGTAVRVTFSPTAAD